MSNILLVEDDTKLLKLYTKLLRHQQHRVVASATFHLVNKLVRRQSFDVIVSDLELGLIQPHTVIKTLAQIHHNHGTPILLISAHLTRYLPVIERYDIFDTLEKPFSNQVLLDSIVQIINRNRDNSDDEDSHDSQYSNHYS